MECPPPGPLPAANWTLAHARVIILCGHYGPPDGGYIIMLHFLAPEVLLSKYERLCMAKRGGITNLPPLYKYEVKVT